MSKLLQIGFSIALFAALVAMLGCDHHSAASSRMPVGVASEPALSSKPAAADSAAKPNRDPREAIDQEPSAARITQTGASSTEPVAAAAAQEPSKPVPIDPASTRAPADRGPTHPGDAQKITFDDLNLGMSQDMVFRPFLVTDRVKELEGTRVRITGFIHAGAAGTKGIREFVLLKNTQCKFGAGGQADHLAMVYLSPGQTTKYQVEAVKVEGVLKVKPTGGPDGNTWSVYDLADAKLVQ